MIYVIVAVIVIAVAVLAHMRGAAKREIEFRKAFKRKCLEDERRGL